MHKEFVYALKAGPYYKIGRTENLTRRIGQLATQFPFPVELFKVFNTDDSVRLERELHFQFAKNRVNGEWFALSPRDAMELIMMCPAHPFEEHSEMHLRWPALWQEMCEATWGKGAEDHD